MPGPQFLFEWVPVLSGPAAAEVFLLTSFDGWKRQPMCRRPTGVFDLGRMVRSQVSVCAHVYVLVSVLLFLGSVPVSVCPPQAVTPAVLYVYGRSLEVCSSSCLKWMECYVLLPTSCSSAGIAS